MVRINSPEVAEKLRHITHRYVMFVFFGKGNHHQEFVSAINDKIDYLSSVDCLAEDVLIETLDEINELYNEQLRNYSKPIWVELLRFFYFTCPKCYNESKNELINTIGWNETEDLNPRYCEHCHKSISTKRLNAKYCGNKCKQTAYRNRNNG